MSSGLSVLICGVLFFSGISAMPVEDPVVAMFEEAAELGADSDKSELSGATLDVDLQHPQIQSRFVGQTVGLYNPGWRKFVTMVGHGRAETMPSHVLPQGPLAVGMTWERFEVVAGSNGHVGFYSRIHRKFIKAHMIGRHGAWEGSPRRQGTLPSGWNLESFIIQDRGHGVVNIYNPSRNRRMRMNEGTHVGEDASGNDNGNGPWSRFIIIPMPPSIEVVSQNYLTQTIGMYNPHFQKYASMLDGGSNYRMEASRVLPAALPGSATWERFQVVNGYNRRIGLFCPVHRRFVKAEGDNHWTASQERSDGRLGNSHWHLEQFEIWARHDLGQGVVNIYSPARDRFMVMNGNGNSVGTETNDHGNSHESKFRIVPFRCVPQHRQRGFWQQGDYTDGQIGYRYETGVTRGSSQGREQSWSNTVGVSVTAGYNWGVTAAGGSVEVSVSNEYTQGASTTIERSMELSSTREKSLVFPRGGLVWQWTYNITDTCGTALLSTTAMVQTNNRHQPPCCLPTDARNPSVQHGIDVCQAGTPVLQVAGCIASLSTPAPSACPQWCSSTQSHSHPCSHAACSHCPHCSEQLLQE